MIKWALINTKYCFQFVIGAIPFGEINANIDIMPVKISGTNTTVGVDQAFVGLTSEI